MSCIPDCTAGKHFLNGRTLPDPFPLPHEESTDHGEHPGVWAFDVDGCLVDSLCVDDSPDDLPRAVRAVAVRPYLAPNPADRALLEVLAALEG
jgi:hypothetical protein